MTPRVRTEDLLSGIGATIFVVLILLSRELWRQGHGTDALRVLTMNLGILVILVLAGDWWLVAGAVAVAVLLLALGLGRIRQGVRREGTRFDRAMNFILVVGIVAVILMSLLDPAMWLPGEMLTVGHEGPRNS